MGRFTCALPPMPEYAEIKEGFEHRVYRSILSGWGQYFMGLGALEEIKDLDASLSGNMVSSRSSLNTALDHFNSAREFVMETLQLCLELREALPESARSMLTPNIELYRKTASLLDEAVKAISSCEVPSLECMHEISNLIREDMIFGERMAKVNRGSPGHFPCLDGE